MTKKYQVKSTGMVLEVVDGSVTEERFKLHPEDYELLNEPEKVEIPVLEKKVIEFKTDSIIEEKPKEKKSKKRGLLDE